MTTNNGNRVQQFNIVPFASLDTTVQDLLKSAVEVRTKAYCPYSKFQVGACLLCDDGTTFTGCNIENAAFTVGICAERSAYAAAISNGHLNFKTIAVVALQEYFWTPPCGACRQFMNEFGDVEIYLAKPQLNEVVVTSLKELLPMSFMQNVDKSF